MRLPEMMSLRKKMDPGTYGAVKIHSGMVPRKGSAPVLQLVLLTQSTVDRCPGLKEDAGVLGVTWVA